MINSIKFIKTDRKQSRNPVSPTLSFLNLNNYFENRKQILSMSKFILLKSDLFQFISLLKVKHLNLLSDLFSYNLL
jgi:hypothetical protein